MPLLPAPYQAIATGSKQWDWASAEAPILPRKKQHTSTLASGSVDEDSLDDEDDYDDEVGVEDQVEENDDSENLLLENVNVSKAASNVVTDRSEDDDNDMIEEDNDDYDDDENDEDGEEEDNDDV